MGRGGKKSVSSNRSKKGRKKDSEDDGSDEDYVFNEDDEEFLAVSEEEEYVVSEDGSLNFEIYDDDDVFISDYDNKKKKNKRKVVRSKPNKKDNLEDRKETWGWRSVKKKTIVSDDEKDDCDYEEEDEDDEEFKLDDEIEKSGFVIYDDDGNKNRKSVRSKEAKRQKKDIVDREKTRVRRSVNRTKVSDEEEEDKDYDFNDDDDEEEDKEDEEFKPDEIDFGDEEEEDLEIGRRGSVTTNKTGVVKTLKRKKNSKVLKKSARKKQRRSVMRRPVTVSSDDDFDLDYKTVREMNRKKSRRRNKSVVEDSDSDCPAPSDVEYTISDEEKEMLMDANKFLGNSTTCSRNLSLLERRLHVNGSSKSQQPRPIGRKGKEKVRDLQIDTGQQVCGICFTEEGKGIVRGTLNCCSHYFCFACINEWSKIESRCPLCKQRFVTISKHARSRLGVDLRSLVIPVPIRDQVYQPSEEELMGYLDPYDGVVCIECHQGGDDNLMLLCDTCDSPAHTYCVGLGREVPEGNWYCRGCRVSDPRSSNVHDQNPSHGTSNGTHRIDLNDSNPTPLLSGSALDPSLLPQNEILTSPRYTDGEDVDIVSPSGLGVSTLLGRRRIHRQIRNLLSNNRVNQTTEVAGRIDASIVESEVVADSDDEQKCTKGAGTSVGSGFHSDVFQSWVQDANPSLILERDPISASLSRLRSSTTNINDSASRNVYAEFDHSNSLFGTQQLHRCSSSSYSPTDASEFPRQRRQSSHLQGEGPLE